VQVKYAPPRGNKWAFMRWADIPSDTDRTQVYLRRLRIVQTPWWSVYLHWINEPDSGRHPHDHPWNFYSLILSGGYTEDVYAWPGAVPRRRRHRQGSLHRMGIHDGHSIVSVEPGLRTLVFTGRRVRTFCFWTEDGLVPWTEYRG
jgi:hypothetical protein